MKFVIRISHGDNNIRTARKHSLINLLVLFIAFWPFLFGWVSSLPGILRFLKYLPDAILAVLVVLSLCSGRIAVGRKLLVPAILAFLFFLYTLIVYLFNFESAAYYFWGFRNNFRFIIAFFAFVAFLDEGDVRNWIRWVDRLYWINLLISLFQFFFLGLRGDYLGGIFGTAKGVNASSIVLIFVVLCRSLVMTFRGDEKVWVCILKCVSSMFITAAAELKFMIVLFVVLLCCTSLMSRISWKKIFIVCIAMALLKAGIDFATELFGYHNTLALESLWELATKRNYASGVDVNRLAAIEILSETIVKNPIEQIFGLGLGNCDTSSFAVCNTVFYQQYGYLHYTWNMSAMLFLETGYLGLMIYFLFLISCGLAAYKQYKSGQGDKINSQVALLMAGLCVLLTFYNSSLRTEAAYIIYAVLALPFVCNKTTEMELHPKTKSNTVANDRSTSL